MLGLVIMVKQQRIHIQSGSGKILRQFAAILDELGPERLTKPLLFAALPHCRAGELTVSTPLYMANNSTNFCTKPCCTTADCDSSTVCFATGAGGNYCVNPTWIGRTATFGTATGGAACKVDSDCRSGLCAASGVPPAARSRAFFRAGSARRPRSRASR